LEVPGMSPREECGKMSKNEKTIGKNGKKVDRGFRSQLLLTAVASLLTLHT